MSLETFVNTGRNGIIKSEARSACNTLSPLTYQPITEVNMAKQSLPKNLSIDNLEFGSIPKNPRFINRTGQRFGRLFVLGYAGKIRKVTAWFCLCDCGAITKVVGSRLHNGTSQSCGCLQRELAKTRSISHGDTAGGHIASEYYSYIRAKSRCQNPANKDYANYGGRGIEFRFASYAAFFAEMGRKPTRKHSLDRIDSNGHYEAGNVRWATDTQQAQNKRNNLYLTANGITKQITVWSQDSNLNRTTILMRLSYGWCESCAVTQPTGSRCLHK